MTTIFSDFWLINCIRGKNAVCSGDLHKKMVLELLSATWVRFLPKDSIKDTIYEYLFSTYLSSVVLLETI